MVEGLDDACPGNELTEDVSRMPAAEVDRLDAVGRERIGRILACRRVRVEELDGIGTVDDDATVPGGKTAEDVAQVDPAHGDDDDVRLAAAAEWCPP